MASTQSADGTTIGYDELGDGPGPAVILVHGITESAASWAPITDRLAGSHRVVTLDLRGHGRSATADRYDLEAMAGDVVAVAAAVGADRPHLVGHSLGGAVVSAVGAVFPVRSIVNVDQPLQLAAFKALLMPAEPLLRDATTFADVMHGIFADMAGPLLPPAETDRLTELRRPVQDVVLGVWDLLLTMGEAEIAAVVDSALAGYAGTTTPYLSLFGLDPGDDYAEWLGARIATASVELWPDHGHYPHLVDPDRFVERLEAFWAASS